ncbi:MAG TPA: 16S rRNA (uracil(1498)-N(3))-methyltransferase [Gallicola sp.]|nr:16S rRNA (uracil(1498)-N(3))-methyltransferase [Gallicola sp.]
MQRYFVSNKSIKNNKITITDGDCYHMYKVMRMVPGDIVLVCDEDQKTYRSQIETINNEEVILTILETLKQNNEMKIKVTVAQGLIRREKQEEVVQKITQLGAYAYLPVEMEYSIVKVKTEKVQKKKERMQKIAKEASEQSHRSSILKVYDPVSFKELVDIKDQYDLCLFAYEEIAKTGESALKKILESFNGTNILILFGPEGGISNAEAQILSERGFLPVELGPRILRTETAPLYFLSAISYQFELGDQNEI